MGDRLEPTDQPPKPRRGRPRSVTSAEALDAAMRVFWAAGYDAATVDRLCHATRMPRASLYQDYGGKEGLFLAAIAHYVDTQLGPVADALGPNGTLEADLSAFFDAVVALATRNSQTPGCLIACALADAAGTNETFRRELDSRFSALEDRIAHRLSAADADASTDEVHTLAGLLAAVARGIMLRARSGTPAEALAAIGQRAVLDIARV